MMEVFAGFLSHTDHHLGRLLDFLRGLGKLDNTIIMVISDNGASAEGGPGGTTNEAQFFNNAQEPLEESLAHIDEIGGPKHFNHYPWGWTWAGNTPFRRWKRETYRGGTSDPFIVHWPAGIDGEGRGAHPVRAHHRHGADGARPARHRAARRDPRRDPVAAPRGQLRPRPRRRRRPRAAAARSTSRCSGTGRSTTTAGGRSARGRGRRSPRPASRLRRADHRRRPRRARRRRVGAVPRRRGLRGEPRRRRRQPRPADRDDRHLVRRGRQVRRAAHRRQRPRADGRPRSRSSPRPATATATTRTPSRSRSSPARGCSTGRTASPPTSRSPTAAPRACCSARAPPPAGTRSSSRTASCATSTTTSAAASTGSTSDAPGADRAARAALRVRADRPARPGQGQGRARDAASSTWTAPWSATPRCPSPRRSSSTRARSPAGPTPDRPVTPDYVGPFAFTGHHPQRHGRRQRRADHRRRGGAARAHGAPVTEDSGAAFRRPRSVLPMRRWVGDEPRDDRTDLRYLHGLPGA